MQLALGKEALEIARRDSVSIVPVMNFFHSNVMCCVLKTNGVMCPMPRETICGSGRGLSWGTDNPILPLREVGYQGPLF